MTNSPPEERKTRKSRKGKEPQGKSGEPYPPSWVVDGSLVLKATKALFQKTDEFRGSLAFKAYLSVGDSHTSTGGTPDEERDITFQPVGRSTTPEGEPIPSEARPLPAANRLWKGAIRAASGQQNLQLVPPISPAVPVITPTSTGEVLQYAESGDSRALGVSPRPSSPREGFVASPRLISDLQQHVGKTDPPRFRSSTLTRPEPEPESSPKESRQPTVRSGSSDSRKSETTLPLRSNPEGTLDENNPSVAEEASAAPVTPQGTAALPLRVVRIRIREEVKIPLVQFSPSPVNLFEFRNPGSHIPVTSSPSSSSAQSIPSSRFPLFCTPLANRHSSHYFPSPASPSDALATDNPSSARSSPNVDERSPSENSGVVEFIEPDHVPENQRQERTRNWDPEQLLDLFRPRIRSEGPTPNISGPRVQELRDSVDPALSVPLPESSESSDARTEEGSIPDSFQHSEEEEETPDSPQPPDSTRSPTPTPETSATPEMSGAGGGGGAGGQPNPPVNLSREDIQNIAMTMFAMFTQNIAGQANTPVAAPNIQSKGYFKATDVGFFDPKLEDSYGAGDVVQVGRDVYYRDVFLFVERIKDAVTTYGAETVRANLSTCLRGTAQIWYTEGLSDLEKQALRSLGEGADHWCEALVKKFRQPVASALQKLSGEKYSLEDVKDQRDISSFVFSVMRHAKAANISDLYSQLTWAYNAIAPEIRRDIDPPRETTSITSFLEQLENKRDTWHQIYSRKFNSGYKKYGGYGDYQSSSSSYPKRQEHKTYDKPQQRLIQGPENEGETNSTNSPPNAGEKGKTPEATPPWKDRTPMKEYNAGGRDDSGYQGRGESGYQSNKGKWYTSKGNWDRQSRYQGRDRYQNNRQDNFQDNSRHKDRPREQEAYTGNYEHGSSYDSEPYEEIDPNEEYDGDDPDIQYSYNLTPESPGVCRKCGAPRENFASNNSFHAHIRACKEPVKVTPPPPVEIPNLPVIESSAPTTVGNGLGFRSYRYATVWIIVALQTPVEAVADSGCAVSLIDEAYLRQILPAEKAIKMTAPINVRGIGNAFRESDSYLLLDLYLDGVSRGSPARGYFRREVHIVNDLKCKVLLGMDILGAEQVTLNMKDKTMVLPTCKDLVVPIRIAPKPNARIRRVVHSKDQTVIPAKAVAQVPTYLKGKRLPDDRDYLFEPDQEQLAAALGELGGFYAHVCGGNLACVQVKNDRDVAVKIPRRARLGTLTEYEEEGCYQLDGAYHDVAVVTSVKQMKAWFENSDSYGAFHGTEDSESTSEDSPSQDF